MDPRRAELQALLGRLEGELRTLELWSGAPPSAQALSSTEPFCVDTLNLSQWLQWILIPRMRALLEGGHPLPGNCNIHGIAVESFKGMAQDCSRLLALIETFDRTLAEPQ